MGEIDRILTERHINHCYATVDGVRVRPDTAYKANGVCHIQASPSKYVRKIEELIASATCLGDKVVSVECGFVMDPQFPGKISIKVDHHNPGDAGFGRSPAEYWEASSLGQVMTILDPLRVVSPTRYHRFLAAADHCLERAYRGQCPHVDPDDLLKFRLESRAEFQKRSVEAVMTDVRAAMEIIERERELEPGLVDLRGQQIPELPEASAYMGVAVLSGPFQCPDGRLKYNLLSCTPEQGQKFLDKAYMPELEETYGDPQRGIVGGYLRPNFAK
jgi:hypothetical protein